ncbi:peptidoglycan hydrolase-like protein with peptidoglycan-binding domain [Clostridium acetobutylicum]|uniref:Diverged Metallo-dependent hydrolase(Zn) of DD-Peptidase family peptodoglycan-binding domain n=1 Tax=Clostridium acetobutylicum (strain ATCC 824 / DSM 792 / JCM 1419 / IAM 19013 / LMG 5710 / NBRC 13948 / NRRL B-527 / VKM B-1787 / 2291 / W) TaxID=272562 RepID=Q97FN3_CLOAB|nr:MULTISPECIES: peptidoglycan-binding protein [Clostridium]AAK80642.1 Diverged Metallo-dependent hydrolase(Zn) of DD-Peptidase family; peptodoglycan-binding domain [Clostridium acetobutylicum ATCC 824]ADZ21741.1 Diverged Metallo-dependent hydrolase(Zn) of DD-Peptidase family [Clostridium acetobutylicum EA 2018]AEI32504.1 metallo-dependent hydrolase [Clostridium acetobutylicum DSM 1731]AWV78941.1 peptidoglycan-binding protein [Clostridium acetobutylicum]MBC2395180.1 peptidoglycan-binding prote
MKNLKLKALSLGIVSTVLISSSAFAATNTKTNVTKPTINSTVQASVKPSKTYGEIGDIATPNQYGGWDFGSQNMPTLLSEGVTVKEWDSGLAVKEIQTALYYYFLKNDSNVFHSYNMGDPNFINGIFGYSTYALIVEYQVRTGLSDGIAGAVGAVTWASLRVWDL